MFRSFPLFPEQASTAAARTDHLYFFLILVSAFFAGMIFLLILFFSVKYRRRPGHERATQITKNIPLEIAWTGIPLMLTMVMFAWGAKLFFNVYRTAAGRDGHLCGRQTMDVEVSAPRGPLGDQRTPRSAWSAREAVDDFGRCDP